VPGDQLSRLLLKLFAQGDISGTTVHDLAVAAWLDGWGRDCPLANDLVKAGQSGRRRNRIANDVIKSAEASMVAECGLPAMCLDPDTLNAANGLPKLLREWSNHDDVQFHGDLAQVGVLGFHADGVQYTTSMRAGGARTVLAGSMNVISARDEIRHRRQPLFVLRKARLCSCGCQGFHTIQQIMEVIAWSMRCLLHGGAPSNRHDGTAWTALDMENRLQAGTVIPQACLLQVRGD
jgi:hypothetical protein